MYRLIEVVIAKKDNEKIENILNNRNILDYWREESYQDKIIYKILTKTEYSQILIDRLQKNFSKDDRFRIVVLDVEATVPIEEKKSLKKIKISREEIYSKIISYSEINYIYVIMMILSTVIAAFGIISNNIPVIIGAMVIAPLLGPNIAISFASVIGDVELEKSAFKVLSAGVMIAFVFSFLIGLFYHLDISNPQIISRVSLNVTEIVIAVASGLAGVLAFTAGASESLVGVMVAISLLPPVVASGLLFANADYFYSLKSFMLFLENFVSLNLAGILMFTYQGIKAKNWWEEKKAKEHRKKAMFIWALLLLVLVLIIYLDRFYFEKI